MTRHRVLATASLAGGLLGLSGIMLYSTGRMKEAQALAVAGATVGMFLSAIQIIADEPPVGAPGGPVPR